jgi:hypothetical protein
MPDKQTTGFFNSPAFAQYQTMLRMLGILVGIEMLKGNTHIIKCVEHEFLSKNYFVDYTKWQRAAAASPKENFLKVMEIKMAKYTKGVAKKSCCDILRCQFVSAFKNYKTNTQTTYECACKFIHDKYACATRKKLPGEGHKVRNTTFCPIHSEANLIFETSKHQLLVATEKELQRVTQHLSSVEKALLNAQETIKVMRNLYASFETQL